MAKKVPGSKPTTRAAAPANDVERLLASLDHPFKKEIVALRQVILGADPSISEGVKWNAPSFRTSEYFATFHLRAKDGVQIILHLGAKKRADLVGVSIPDPGSLMHWLGKDRASVMFRDRDDVEAKRAAFAEIIRHWIGYV